MKQTESPWQLQQFRRSLKKQLKLKALLDLLGDVKGENCLLVTCGDNNGALNWKFREAGGRWSWADLEAENLGEVQRLLDEPILHAGADSLPFGEEAFENVVCIDVLEHLDHDQPFLRELMRVLHPGGRLLITVPNGNPSLFANRIKGWLGMTPDVYGHKRAGYTPGELASAVEQAGLLRNGSAGYSRFFTELVELGINFGYVFLLSRGPESKPGSIAPKTADEMQQHGWAYRIYSLAYPVFRMISALDRLLPENGNYAVIVSAVKPSP